MKKFIAFIKRPQVWGFLVSLAVMALISLAFFYPDNFKGNSLMQPDMVQGAANGHEAQQWEAESGQKALWTNSLFSGMPTFQISPSYPSNSLFNWFNGAYGLWLPQPSNLLMMMMLGFFILMYALGKRWYYALIGAIAWGFSSYFVIIIGAGHIWKFMALTYIPPTIAGLVLLYRRRYILGTAITAFFAMMQLAANHPQMSYYFGIVMAIMVICYLIDAIRRKVIPQWLKATGCLLAAGILALCANAPSLYNTYEYSKQTKRAQSELAAASTASESSAERPTGGMPKDQILGWSYGPSELFTLVIPNIKGGASAKPMHGENMIKSLADLDEGKQILQQHPEMMVLNALPQYFNDSEGTNGPVYVGVIIAALFLLGCFIVKGPIKWAMLASTVLSCILALGYNAESISDLMIYHFPLYNKFRAVESILVIAEFAMPLLAVLALSKFIEAGAEAWKKWRTQIIVSFSIPAAIAVIALLVPSAFGKLISSQDMYYQNRVLAQVEYYYASQGASDSQIDALLYEMSLSNPQVAKSVTSLRASLVKSDALRSLLFLALAFAVLAWFGCGKLRKPYAVSAVGLLVLIDLFNVDKRYVDSDSFTAPSTHSFGIEPDSYDSAILVDTTAHFRVLDIPGFDQPRRSFFHHMIGGYHAAKLNRYEDIINNAFAPIRNRSLNPVAPANAADSTALKITNMLNAKYIITGRSDYPLILNTRAMGNAWLVDSVITVSGAVEEMEALLNSDISAAAIVDSAFESDLPEEPSLAPGDSIYLTYYSPNTLKYHVTSRSGSVAVFSEVFFPWGWKASIDGHPAQIFRANYILRAMNIPAGVHEITMSFEPESIKVTNAVAYAAVSIIYLILILGIFVQSKRWQLF